MTYKPWHFWEWKKRGHDRLRQRHLPGLVLSAIRSSPRCAAPLCGWRAGWRCVRGRCVRRAADTAACSCASPSECCPAALVLWTPLLDSDQGWVQPPSGWWCTHHQIYTHGETTDMIRMRTTFISDFIHDNYYEGLPKDTFYFCPLLYYWVLVPYLFFKCCTLPKHRNLPLTIMAMRVHRASHSSILKQTKKRDTSETILPIFFWTGSVPPPHLWLHL